MLLESIAKDLLRARNIGGSRIRSRLGVLILVTVDAGGRALFRDRSDHEYLIRKRQRPAETIEFPGVGGLDIGLLCPVATLNGGQDVDCLGVF